jgi:hypothetical protein
VTDINNMNFTQDQVKTLIQILSAQVQEPVDSFEQKIEDRTIEVLNKRMKNLEKIEKFNALFVIALEPHLGLELAEFVVDCLNEGRKDNNRYYSFLRAYPKVRGDIHKRAMLRMVRALYQRHYTDPADKAIVSKLNSEIKYASACDHCGNLARQVQDYVQNNSI